MKSFCWIRTVVVHHWTIKLFHAHFLFTNFLVILEMSAFCLVWTNQYGLCVRCVQQRLFLLTFTNKNELEMCISRCRHFWSILKTKNWSNLKLEKVVRICSNLINRNNKITTKANERIQLFIVARRWKKTEMKKNDISSS